MGCGVVEWHLEMAQPKKTSLVTSIERKYAKEVVNDPFKILAKSQLASIAPLRMLLTHGKQKFGWLP